MLNQVETVLRWRGECELAAELYTITIECLSGAFRAALLRLETSQARRVATLREALSAFTGESFLRILTAPETFRRLSKGASDDGELLCFVETSVAAEWSRDGGSKEFVPDGTLWTALGDYACFSDEKILPGNCRASLAGGIPVDFDSPYTCSPDIPVEGHGAPFEMSDRIRLVGELNRALAGISAASAAAVAVVQLYTRVIVPKRDHEQRQFLSSSSPRYPGRTVLCNPGQASVEMLAEGLVHESIHGLLAALQLRRPFVLDHRLLSQATVVSPWTGNVIPVDAFVEACFVWFGICNFWTLAAGSSVFSQACIEPLAKRSRLGFDGSALVGLLAGFEQGLSDEVFTTIEAMQASVRTYSTSDP